MAAVSWRHSAVAGSAWAAQVFARPRSARAVFARQVLFGFRAAGPVGFRGGAFAANQFRGGYYRPGFRHRGFPYAAAAVVGAGLAYGAYHYGYYDDGYYGNAYYANYPYDDYGNYGYGAGYYGDGGCYVVRQRVPTPYGWVLRPVQVCN